MIVPCHNCQTPIDTEHVKYARKRNPLIPYFCGAPECTKARDRYRWRNGLYGESNSDTQPEYREPMKLLDKQPELHQCQSCDKCSFVEICRLRVELELPVACEKWDTMDLEKLNNHPQYEEAMRVMQLKPNMLF